MFIEYLILISLKGTVESFHFNGGKKRKKNWMSKLSTCGNNNKNLVLNITKTNQF